MGRTLYLIVTHNLINVNNAVYLLFHSLSCPTKKEKSADHADFRLNTLRRSFLLDLLLYRFKGYGRDSINDVMRRTMKAPLVFIEAMFPLVEPHTKETKAGIRSNMESTASSARHKEFGATFPLSPYEQEMALGVSVRIEFRDYDIRSSQYIEQSVFWDAFSCNFFFSKNHLTLL